MLQPVLEIVVVWHPEDPSGWDWAQVTNEHFMQGTTLSSVIGGGIHVSVRSSGWLGTGKAPRPIYSESNPAPSGLSSAKFVAIVPLLGVEMAAAVEDCASDWRNYLFSIRDAEKTAAGNIGIFPFSLSNGATNGTKLGKVFGGYQFVAAGDPDRNGEDAASMFCRDLTQGIAQLVSPDEMDRLTAFISHTKRHSNVEGEDVGALVDLVREVIGNTRLNDYFDANDLQPGTDWDAELKRSAGTSAMLAVRTDLYSSREWCQREIAIAKTNGMPVIMMDAIGFGEERGSFLMDHVPRIAVRKSDGQWRKSDVFRALNRLVDECLKRALWLHQRDLGAAHPELDVAWWAPHAPEPFTLSRWIGQYLATEGTGENEGDIRILHPEPPLGPEEREVLLEYTRNSGLGCEIDILTPRQLAMRGG